MTEIIACRMSFRCSTLFMIKKKYLNIDLFDVDLTKMEGHDVPDLVDRLMPLEGQGFRKAFLEEAEVDQL